MSDQGYRGLVDCLSSGTLQAHGFLAAVESRVDASLPRAAEGGTNGNVVSLAARLAPHRRARP